MEHELRVYAEVVCQPEACGVFLPVIRKLLAKTNEHAVEPAKNVRRVVNLRLEYGDARH